MPAGSIVLRTHGPDEPTTGRPRTPQFGPGCRVRDRRGRRPRGPCRLVPGRHRTALLSGRSGLGRRRPRLRRVEGDGDRDRRHLRLRRAHVHAARRARRSAGAQRQHARRGARLELVHQPHRAAAAVARGDRARARSPRRGPTSRTGRSSPARPKACSPAIASRIPRSTSGRSSSIRRRTPRWPRAPRSSARRSITRSATTSSRSTSRTSIRRRSGSRPTRGCVS